MSRELARAERRARETAKLDNVLRLVGSGGCPWCFPALISDWDYTHDRPLILVNHDRRCLGPSSRWHRRCASDWLLALLKLYGYGVGDYLEDRLARHRTVG